MGLKEVKDDVISEAEKKAERIRDEGEEEAREIMEEAREKAEEIREESEKEAEEQREKMEKRRVSSARMEARQKRQKAKHAALRQTFRDFRKRIEESSTENADMFLETCMDRAGFEVGSIRASEEFQEAAEDRGFDPEEIESTGIVLISENGERSQSFTMDRIKESMKDEKRKEVSEVLFS
ncbi:MAG: V-type ATP synthase subunit E family protein [Candidatus Nanohaloarchaea archaeon]